MEWQDGSGSGSSVRYRLIGSATRSIAPVFRARRQGDMDRLRPSGSILCHRRQEKCCTKSTLAAAAKVEGPLVFACDLAHDGKTEPGARPAFVEPAAALHRLARLLRVKSGAVVLNTHLDPGPPAGIGAFGGRSGGGARHGDPD